MIRLIGSYHTKGERNIWRGTIYPSEHTKENRRSGLEQKRIRFLTTSYGIFQYRCNRINVGAPLQNRETYPVSSMQMERK